MPGTAAMQTISLTCLFLKVGAKFSTLNLEHLEHWKNMDWLLDQTGGLKDFVMGSNGNPGPIAEKLHPKLKCTFVYTHPHPLRSLGYVTKLSNLEIAVPRGGTMTRPRNTEL